MTNKLIKLSVIVVLLSAITACANTPFYHKNFMRGQIVSVSNESAVVCIGSYKDSLVGQTLNVYQIEFDAGTQEGYDGFRRELIGAVKINSIINEHFARATITSGTVAKNNMVELSR